MDDTDGTVTVTNDAADVRRALDDCLDRFPDTGDDALRERFDRTLAYLWEVCRCAVFVCVRDWRVRCFRPFANLGFRQDWDLDMTRAGDLAAEPPPATWWANAGLLCTRAQGPRGWGTSQLAAYRDLLDETLRVHPVRHAAVFLNKRDHPLVRADGTHPWHHVFRGDPPRVHDGDLLPVLSPYTGPAFLDRPVPTHLDWSVVRGVAFDGGDPPRADVDKVAWKDRSPRALFRGTATHPVRRRLCDRFRDHPDFDAALTRTRGGRLAVARGVVTRVPPSGDAASFLPPHTWSRYRVLLAPDGHAGLNRWMALARSGAHVVRLSATEAPDTVGASLVPHVHIRADEDGWEDRLEAEVARLVRRKTGPRRRSNEALRAGLLAATRAALE